MGGFLKWWYPQNTPKWSFFLVGKPIVVVYHHLRNHPYSLQPFFPTFAKLRLLNCLLTKGSAWRIHVVSKKNAEICFIPMMFVWIREKSLCFLVRFWNLFWVYDWLVASGDVYRLVRDAFLYIYLFINIHTPATQTTPIFIGKDLLLEAKSRNNWFQVYIPAPSKG